MPLTNMTSGLPQVMLNQSGMYHTEQSNVCFIPSMLSEYFKMLNTTYSSLNDVFIKGFHGIKNGGKNC